MRILHVLDHSILREQHAPGWDTFHLTSPKQGLHFYRTPAGWGASCFMKTPPSQPADFTEITQLIASARARAMQVVNTTLIDLYWQVGQFISQRIANAQWGDGVVAALAVHLAQTQPNLRGFTRPNLFRMRQFYQAYQHNVKVSPLSRQLPWSVGAVAIFPTCINLVACQKPGLALCKNVVSKTVEVKGVEIKRTVLRSS